MIEIRVDVGCHAHWFFLRGVGRPYEGDVGVEGLKHRLQLSLNS